MPPGILILGSKSINKTNCSDILKFVCDIYVGSDSGFEYGLSGFG